MGAPLVVTPTIDTDAYTANDAVGGLLTFDFGSGKRTVFVPVVEIDETDATPVEAALDLYLFTDSTLAKADDAAFSISEANKRLGKFVGKISFSSYAARLDTAGKVAVVTDHSLKYWPLNADGQIFGQLVCTGTPTFAAADDLIVTAYWAEYS